MRHPYMDKSGNPSTASLVTMFMTSSPSKAPANSLSQSSGRFGNMMLVLPGRHLVLAATVFRVLPRLWSSLGNNPYREVPSRCGSLRFPFLSLTRLVKPIRLPLDIRNGMVDGLVVVAFGVLRPLGGLQSTQDLWSCYGWYAITHPDVDGSGLSLDTRTVDQARSSSGFQGYWAGPTYLDGMWQSPTPRCGL